MIIFEIVLFFLAIIVASTSIAGYGCLIKFKNNDNIFTDIFLGFIFISSLLTFTHFFIKIDHFVSLIIFTLGIVFFLINKRFNIYKELRKKIFYITIILILLPMFISQKYHEDFGYYHLPYVLALIEEKIIFGFANIDKPYVYNSIWLNLKPIFYFDKSFNFLTLPSFILFLFFLIFSINKVLRETSFKLSDYFMIICLFYFILKFTRISEFGVDLPGVIFSILSIYYFIRFIESNDNFEKKELFFLNFIFSIFAILIKLNNIPVILLSLYLYFFDFKNLKFIIFKKKFLLIYLIFFIFFVQQFIYTGCLLFPTKFTCLNVSWFHEDHLKLSKQLELINKSYSIAKDIYSPEEYLNNLKWFSFWFKRNLIEIIEHLLTIFLPTLIFILCLPKKKKIKFSFNKKLILSIFVLISILFWLNFSPVFRFAIHIFVTLIFLVLAGFLINREFSKKKFLIFLMIFIFFNFSKNISRIKSEEEIFLGIKKIDNDYVLNKNISNKHAKIYYPNVKKNKKNGWQGRLCWDTPFICSYNNLEIKKNNRYLIINKLKK